MSPGLLISAWFRVLHFGDSPFPRDLVKPIGVEVLLRSRSLIRRAIDRSIDGETDVLWVCTVRDQHLHHVAFNWFRLLSCFNVDTYWFMVPATKQHAAPLCIYADWASSISALKSYAFFSRVRQVFRLPVPLSSLKWRQPVTSIREYHHSCSFNRASRLYHVLHRITWHSDMTHWHGDGNSVV